MQHAGLLVNLIANTQIHREVLLQRPVVLGVEGSQRTRVGVSWIAKTLLIELGSTQRSGLQRGNLSRWGRQSAGSRELQARAKHRAREVAEDKASRKEGVRLGVIATQQFITAELQCVLALDHAEVISKFIATHDGQAGNEDLITQVRCSRNVQANLAGSIGEHVKVIIVILDAGFVQSLAAELVEP